MRNDRPSTCLDKRKISQISIVCMIHRDIYCRSLGSYLSPQVQSQNSSTRVQASHTLYHHGPNQPANQLKLSVLMDILSFLQIRRRWSVPISSNLQTSSQASTLPPPPAARLPSQTTWTPTSILLVSYKHPMPPRARRKSRPVSAVSSNLTVAERGPSIAASRRTCWRCVDRRWHGRLSTLLMTECYMGFDSGRGPVCEIADRSKGAELGV